MKKLAEKIRRVGLIANPGKPACRAVVREAIRHIRASGREPIPDAATAELAGFTGNLQPDAARVAAVTDLLLVFGGDGTMLRVAHETAGAGTPLVGVNLGGLGFLTGIPATAIRRGLAAIWRGEFRMEQRPLIDAGGKLRGQRFRRSALNDFVVSRGAGSRLIELDVTVDGEPLTRYRCDGLIVSSPTGSTAYSLAAGGAVVSPTAEVFALTPICPHTLSNRSVIVNLDATIGIRACSEKQETILSADGEVLAPLAAGDLVVIRRSARSIRLVQLTGHSFFQTLRQKLHWSGSNI